METEHQKPDEMTDDEWLLALEGKTPEGLTEHEKLIMAQLRDVLSSRHAFTHDLVDAPAEKTITQIRERLLSEGLMSRQNHQNRRWGDRRLAERVGIIAFSLALAGMVAFLIMPGFFREAQWVMKPGAEESVRGPSTLEVSRAFPEVEWMGSRVQMVMDVQQAMVAWEADLVAAGMEYVSDVEKGEPIPERNLHIKLSENIRFLTAEHQRLFAALPRSGEWVLILRKTDVKTGS